MFGYESNLDNNYAMYFEIILTVAIIYLSKIYLKFLYKKNRLPFQKDGFIYNFNLLY